MMVHVFNELFYVVDWAALLDVEIMLTGPYLANLNVMIFDLAQVYDGICL